MQEDNKKHLLKVYGSTFETKSSIVARFSGKKRTFSYDPAEPDARKRAKTDACAFLEEMTMQNKYSNSYFFLNSIAHIEVGCEKNHSVKFTVMVDQQDLSKLENKVWYVRTNKDGQPCHVYFMSNEPMCQHRVYLPEHLFGTLKVTYRDKNVLNNVRSNVCVSASLSTTVCTDKIVDLKKKERPFSIELSGSEQSAKISHSPQQQQQQQEKEEEEDDEDEKAKARQFSKSVTKKPVLYELSDCPNSFERFCYPEGPSIPKHEWKACKQIAKQSPKHEAVIVAKVAKCLGQRYPTFPFPRYSDVKIRESTDRVLGFKVCPESQDLGRNYAGQLLCKQFMLEVMFECGYRLGGEHVTSAKMWKDQKKRARVLAYLLKSNRIISVTPETLLAAITFCYYVPSNFRPTAAKTIYELFGGAGRVLDLCSGYGGRLVGFWFARNTTHYVGFDPNKRLLSPYNQIADWLKKSYPQTDKSYRFLQCGSETKEACDVLGSEAPFDLVFTSPPYFDCELYDMTDPTQSFNAHGSSYRSWLTGFLFVALRNGCDAIKTGGYMVINVANGKRFPTLVEDTVEYATQTLHLMHEKTMRYVLTRRPGSRKDNYEPVLVFKKT